MGDDWPDPKGRGSRAAKLARGGCEQSALEWLKLHPKGRVIKIKPKFGQSLGPVRVPGEGGGTITEWFDHEAVIDGGRVFDDLTGPCGMTLEDYKRLFQCADDLQFGP